jgi:hypothetical protein
MPVPVKVRAPRPATPAGWRGQLLLAGQNLVGNQAVATQAATPVVPPPRRESTSGGNEGLVRFTPNQQFPTYVVAETPL